ncbi:hypothetical protein GCM10027034_43440 [Ramlibacter solisilvae]
MCCAANKRPILSSAKTQTGVTAMAYVFETIPADRGLIDLNDPREVSWWRKQFECSEEQLRKAVEQVGNSSATVEQWLDGRKIVTI